MDELNKEYMFRYNKQQYHKSVTLLYNARITRLAIENYPDLELEKTPFALCMPDEYKVGDNAVQSYRNYYNGDKRHLHRCIFKGVYVYITNSCS